MKRLLLVFSLLWAVESATADERLSSELRDKLSRAAEEALSRTGHTGITVAAGKNGEVIFAAGFGRADIETDAPVTTNTMMRAGSVSKVYTAALIGKLYEAGKLDLDKPVSSYVPLFKNKRWPVSIRQMAAHMGGIRHYKGDEFMNTRHFPTVSAGLRMFIDDRLEFRPGTRSDYSSHAWNLISAALETAGDGAFLELMQEQVFRPLNMSHTMAEDVTKPLPNIARFHTTSGGTTSIAPFVDNSYKWAGGGFVGTASDMARFGLAHTNPGFLQAATLALFATEQHTENGQGTGFGIGWMLASQMQRRLERYGKSHLQETFSDTLIWHSGGSMGAVALLLVDPEQQSVMALMANNASSFQTLVDLGLLGLGVMKNK